MLNRLMIIAGIFIGALSYHVNESPGQSSLPPGAHVAGELLIAGKQGVTDTALENIYRGMGAKKIQTFPQIGVHHITVPPQALEHVEAALARNPSIQFVEKNFIGTGVMVPNDPGYSSQWHLPKTFAPEGWDISTGSSNVVIAVIDSGVDPNHPDLSNKLVAGYNYVDNNNDTHDQYGHGTAVAGVAAASTNSGVGIAGVAWQNKIMPIVVFGASGYSLYTAWISAITYAADHGAKVINLSIGGDSYSSSLQNAVNYAWNKGCVLVAAAGNGGSNSAYYPATLTNVMAVSATTYYDDLASFSNFGNWIAVAAPGEGIYTTTNGGGYGSGTGTSFATPQVAGLAALIMSLNPNLTNSQVVSLIKQNADDLGSSGNDPYFGSGRINIYRSLLAATQNNTNSTISVEILSPSNGSTIPQGNVNVDVAANSTAGVTRVEFYVNGSLRDTKLSTPYTFAWNTSGLSGQQTLVSRAFDATGKSASSPTETVFIASSDSTPPSVSITSLAYDGKNIMVTGAASDTQTGIAKVELYVDGALKVTDSASPWSFKVNAKPLAKGPHTLYLKAYDGAGNVGVSSQNSITR